MSLKKDLELIRAQLDYGPGSNGASDALSRIEAVLILGPITSMQDDELLRNFGLQVADRLRVYRETIAQLQAIIRNANREIDELNKSSALDAGPRDFQHSFRKLSEDETKKVYEGSRLSDLDEIARLKSALALNNGPPREASISDAETLSDIKTICLIILGNPTVDAQLDSLALAVGHHPAVMRSDEVARRIKEATE